MGIYSLEEYVVVTIYDNLNIMYKYENFENN